jgi:hypothetical protein
MSQNDNNRMNNGQNDKNNDFGVLNEIDDLIIDKDDNEKVSKGNNNNGESNPFQRVNVTNNNNIDNNIDDNFNENKENNDQQNNNINQQASNINSDDDRLASFTIGDDLLI